MAAAPILSLLSALLFAGSASAQTLNSTWSGGPSGNWNVAGSWTPSGVPNNGANLYNVNIPSPAAVTVNGSFAIQSLDVDSGASALLPLGQILTLNADGTIDGVLTMGTLGSSGVARLRVGADLTLAGSGVVNMHRSAGIDSPTGARLTIGPALTVRYHGEAGFDQVFLEPALTNNGTLLFEGDTAFINHPNGQFINSSTGTIRASNTVRVDISATNEPITIVNDGLWEADGGTFILSFAEMTNTGTLRFLNNGTLRSGNNINNTGGTIVMESGGRFIPAASSGNMTLTGGSITGGSVDQSAPEAQGILTLQGGPGADAMDISGTIFKGPVTGSAMLALSGDFDLANNVQILGSMRVNGNVNVNGSGRIQLALSGGTGADTLTLGTGITLESPSAGAFSTLKTINAAGPVLIQSPDTFLSAGSTLVSTGPLRLTENAKIITSDGGRLVLRSNTAQLDAGSEIIGAVSIDAATVLGPGVLLRPALSVIGTNTMNAPILAPATIAAEGAAVINGTGGILNEGASGVTTLNAAVPGTTLTTGPDFNVTLTGHGLTVNVPWRFQGNASFTGGVFVAAADVKNDGEIDLAGNAFMQVNAGANVVAGSTGVVRVGPNAKLEATGPSTLGGSYAVSGDFVFAGGVVPVVGDWDGDGTSEILVNAGATAQFAQQVSRVGTLTVNTSATASFALGLTNVESATARGLFFTIGETDVNGTFSILGGTHGGAGTTTAPNVTLNGTINAGRTVVAETSATIARADLVDATFINKGTAQLLSNNVNVVTGNGTLRNEAILQTSTNLNRNSANFVQTSTGQTIINGIYELNGNSAIDGAVTIGSNDTLVFGAGAADTTHTVNGGVSGTNALLKVSGNTTTGAAPTVELKGPVNLTGAGSATEISGGATLRVVGGAAPTNMGESVTVFTESELQAVGYLFGPLFISLFNLREEAVVKSPEELQLIQAQELALLGNLTAGPRIENTRVIVTERADIDGKTTLAGAVLEIAQGAEANFRDGSRLSDDPTQAFADALLDVRGTFNAQGFADPQNPSPPVVIETSVSVRAGGTLNTQSGATLELSGVAGGVVQLNGVLTIASDSLVRLSNGASLTNNETGSIRGTGRLELIESLLALNGEFAPGFSAGILTVIGDAPFGETAKLSIEIGGTSVGTQYDRLAITNGAATLDGTLFVSLINNFTPAPGDSFTILTATAGVSGVFDNAPAQVRFAGGVFDVNYLSNSVVLTNFAVPEPCGASFVALGGALLFMRNQRRRGRVQANG